MPVSLLSLFWATPLLLFGAAALADEDQYAAVRDKIQTCVPCHGEKGASTQGLFPILAGQEQYYLYVQLKDFKSGLRADPVMGPIASALEKEEMMLIARYFSEQQWPEIDYQATEGEIKTAHKVIAAGECIACHLGSFKGNSRVPRLAGQHPEYLAKTMLDFKNKKRMNAPDIASLLETFSEEELKAMAAFLSGYEGQ
jgi:cytochrome c553